MKTNAAAHAVTRAMTGKKKHSHADVKQQRSMEWKYRMDTAAVSMNLD